MIRYVTVLVLSVFALGASISLRATPPIGAVVQTWHLLFQNPRQNPHPATGKLIRKSSKHSDFPVKGEFQGNQIESAPDDYRRQVREKYNRGIYPEITDPGDQIEDSTVVTYQSVGKADPFPVSLSAAVVIGTVLSGRAFVSKDRTYVYSDYQVRVDKVLKQDPAANLTVGGQLLVSKMGGTIHFPSGHVRNYLVLGYGMPAVGSQYLVFLKKLDPVLSEYEMLWDAAYELKDGRVYSLDDVGTTEFDGVDAVAFLNKVQTVVGASRNGGKP